MDDQEYFVEYHYPPKQRLFSTAVVLILAMTAVSMFFQLILLTVGLLAGLHSNLVAVFGVALFTLVTSYLLLMFANLQVGIRIYERGIAVQFCFLWWLFVPWDDVLYLRSQGWPPFSRSRIVVLRRGLTPLHRLMGLGWGRTMYPSVYLGWRMERLDQCIGAIERKLGERLKQSSRLQWYVQMGLEETTELQETKTSPTD
ncbi:MAG: hypothetical protein KKA73_10560 [Chloroflexi bacterium]|nr:hypothetical protein [Chloroflexota bacterium]MBU1748119.1 hypothetical protein [Chloroflexota bacterium]MBU1878725.1 hypothetical protein [Chloroflexota bacterium]